MAITFCYLISNEICYCCIFSPAIGVTTVLDSTPSNRYVLVFQCSSFYFPDDIWSGTSFHMFIYHLYILWDFCWDLWPIFNHIWQRSYSWVLRVLCEFWIIHFLKIRCVLCKYFLLVCRLYSNFPDIASRRKLVLIKVAKIHRRTIQKQIFTTQIITMVWSLT